jgi:hypothetical protein
MSTDLTWKPARLIDAGDVIVGDGDRFKVADWDPTMPCVRIVMTLVDLADGREFEYTARWDDEYAVAPRNLGVPG